MTKSTYIPGQKVEARTHDAVGWRPGVVAGHTSHGSVIVRYADLPPADPEDRTFRGVIISPTPDKIRHPRCVT
jgi:hypothetical protein